MRNTKSMEQNTPIVPQISPPKKLTKASLYKGVIPYILNVCAIEGKIKPEQVAYDLHRSILGLDRQGKMRPLSDLAIFLMFCNEVGLNPVRRQIWASYIWNSTTGREELTPITSIHGLRSLARRNSKNPKYAYSGEAEIQMDDSDTRKLHSATVPVYGLFGNSIEPVLITKYTALYDEFVGTKKDGTLTAKWSKAPVMMLSKCAEANALRKGFDIDGIYADEELVQDDYANAAPVIDAKEAREWIV